MLFLSKEKFNKLRFKFFYWAYHPHILYPETLLMLLVNGSCSQLEFTAQHWCYWCEQSVRVCLGRCWVKRATARRRPPASRRWCRSTPRWPGTGRYDPSPAWCPLAPEGWTASTAPALLELFRGNYVINESNVHECVYINETVKTEKSLKARNKLYLICKY